MNFAARHPLAAIAIASVAAALCAWSALRLKPDTSLVNLFPRDDRAASALVRVLDHFPSAEELLILATVPAQQPNPDQLLAFADRLRQQIQTNPAASKLVGAINYRTDAQSRDFVAKVMVPNGIFYLSDADFDAATRRLGRQGMTDQLRQDEAMLATPGPVAGGLAKALLRDPLRLHEFIDQRLAASAPFKTYQNSGAFISHDGRSLLIRIAGTRPPSDLEFCKEITSSVSDLARRANTDHLKLEFSGAYPIAAQSERSIRADSKSSVIGSIACLAGLFLIVFRHPLRLFAVTFTPVALGALYGFAIYAATNRGISPLTAVIGAMLAGIGIDYSIFYVVHYLDRRATGSGAVAAAGDTIRAIGPALWAAWVTSVVGFIAIAFASVPALRDFSILGSLGLAGALAGAVFVLPALLVLLDRRTRPVAGTRLSIRPLLGWIDRHSMGCLLLSATIVFGTILWLAAAGPWLGLETNPTVLHPRPNPPLDAEAHIAKALASTQDSLIVYLRADSPQQLLSLAHRANSRLASDPGVASAYGLATLLPDPTMAQHRFAQVGPALAGRVVADFDAAVKQSSFRPEAFDSYKEFLHRLLAPTAVPDVRDLLPYTQLAKTFLPREVFSGADPTEAITLVFLKPSMDQPQLRDACIARLRSSLHDLPGATLTGMGVLRLDSETTIHRDLPRLVLAAVSICLVYLLLHFWSVTHATLAVLPTLCSLVCLLGIARIAGAKMNLANMIALPLLIGVDVDYGIFLVSAVRASTSRADLLNRATASSQAVILCAASTTLGFGSLAFTSVPAVQSLGWAVAIGVLTCALASLFLLLPLLLRRVPTADHYLRAR